MQRKFRITKSQLNELLDADLMFSDSNTTSYPSSEIGVTEPVGDSDFGKVQNTDAKANVMEPSRLNRFTNNGTYGGPIVV